MMATLGANPPGWRFDLMKMISAPLLKGPGSPSMLTSHQVSRWLSPTPVGVKMHMKETICLLSQWLYEVVPIVATGWFAR
jgi:hypothetical protein